MLSADPSATDVVCPYKLVRCELCAVVSSSCECGRALIAEYGSRSLRPRGLVVRLRVGGVGLLGWVGLGVGGSSGGGLRTSICNDSSVVTT